MDNKTRKKPNIGTIVTIIAVCAMLLIAHINSEKERKERFESNCHSAYDCAVDYVTDHYADRNYYDGPSIDTCVEELYYIVLDPEDPELDIKIDTEIQKNAVLYLEEIKNHHNAIANEQIYEYAYQTYGYDQNKDTIAIFNRTAKLLNDKITSFTWYRYEPYFENDYNNMLEYILNASDYDYAVEHAKEANKALYDFSCMPELLRDYCYELEKTDYYEEIYNSVIKK